MNVNAISSSFASQVSANGADKTRQAPPAPPPAGQPPGGGGFVNAIGQALESLGVTDVAAEDKEGAASALGSFLKELMASLHSQGEAKGVQAEGAFGPGGAQGGAGGPGRLAEDLQSLAASLQGESEGGEAGSLETSFSSLLEALGADSSAAQGKLAGFLQTLAARLPQSGSSGNLVNTSA